MRILDTIEREEEPVLSLRLRSQQILDPQELTLPNHSEHALVSIRPRQPSQLIPRLQRHPNPSRPAQLYQPLQPLIPPLPGHTNMVKLPPPRPNSLLDRVQPIKNFHPSSLPPRPEERSQAVE
jgi:hypothetical protein